MESFAIGNLLYTGCPDVALLTLRRRHLKRIRYRPFDRDR
jgi:hypothetical protein